MPNNARQQYDKDEMFSVLSTPFISCLIGGTSEQTGGVFIGNDNLTLRNGTRLDPKYITSISINRRSVTDKTYTFLGFIDAYLKTMEKDEMPSQEELARAGKDAEKLKAQRQKEVAKAKKNAPELLRKQLNTLPNDLLASNGGAGGTEAAGITGTINFTITGDMGILIWLYNYSVSQNNEPSLRLQYGITAGGGKRQRISPILDGMIVDATATDFYNVSLIVKFLPGKALGWSPEQFNKIFGSDKKKKENEGKSTNPKQQKTKPTESQKKAYKEGQAVYDANNARTRQYSKVVEAIAKGLNWTIGRIEPTTVLSEDVMITVESVNEMGPLAYIQKNFCGQVDPKDGDGKTVKAEAISQNGHYRDYIAFFDYNQDKELAFYYLPRQMMTDHMIQNMRIYEYTIQGTNSGEYQSEVLEFTVSPFSLRFTQFNVYSTDGKGKTNLPVVSNSKKEVSNIQYSQESKIKGANAANTNRITKGTAQNPNYRNVISTDTQTALNSYLANLDLIVTNTWAANQGTATMKILYDETVKLNQLIYVCVLLPMNDSVTIGGGRNTKKVIHPSSGLYCVTEVTDDISNSGATTTLTLEKRPYTQETLDKLNEFLRPNANMAKAEQKKQQEAAKNRPENKTASNE